MSSAIVIDWGLFPELALTLARGLDHVFYHSPWASVFPNPQAQLIGSGLDDFGVERVDFPFELLDTPEEPDAWIFPDLYFTDIQQLLRRMGRNVWGAGWGELLEMDRWKLNDTLKRGGHSVPQTQTIDGIPALRTHLEDPKSAGRFMKIAQFYRGLTETKEHRGWPASRSWYESITHDLGQAGDTFRFMSQEAIQGEAVEPGIDLLIVNGVPLRPMMMGYERKDSGIISKLIEEIPDWVAEPAQSVIDALSEEGSPYTNFFSFEARKTGDDVFITDATCRIPRPVDAIHMEMWDNLPQIMVAGAKGESVVPKPKGKYAAQIVLSSHWLQDHPLHVTIPDECRDNVKLWHFYRDADGEYWCLPDRLHDPAFGSVVAVGNSVEEVKAKCLEYADAVEADEKRYEEDVFEKIDKEIEQGRTLGVEF